MTSVHPFGMCMRFVQPGESYFEYTFTQLLFGISVESFNATKITFKVTEQFTRVRRIPILDAAAIK